MQQCSFEDEGKIESSSRYKSKIDLMSSYADKEVHLLDETKNLLPQVRKLINQKNSLVSTRDVERNTLKFVVLSDKKVSKMEVKLDKISIPDKIQLHKQTRDVIYSDLLHANVKVTKLQSLVDKMEVQLKHEKVENKTNAIQIKKLQADIISLGMKKITPKQSKECWKKRTMPSKC